MTAVEMLLVIHSVSLVGLAVLVWIGQVVCSAFKVPVSGGSRDIPYICFLSSCILISLAIILKNVHDLVTWFGS